MRNVRDLLVERMDSDFGLLDKLLGLSALTFPETGRIKSEKSIFDRNDKLLELIFNKMKHRALLTALIETGQEHLFNLVRGNGGLLVEVINVAKFRRMWTFLSHNTIMREFDGTLCVRLYGAIAPIARNLLSV